MKIIEKSGYQALPWVRYITQSGGKAARLPRMLGQGDPMGGLRALAILGSEGHHNSTDLASSCPSLKWGQLPVLEY